MTKNTSTGTESDFSSGFFMPLKWLFPVLFLVLLSFSSRASQILIQMDAETQQNHLKAYGITYWSLERGNKVQWLLNYRGGAFLFSDSDYLYHV